VAAEIPQMTPKEREIVSYLLRKNQKMFTCTSDGGYANTLISKGIVVCALLGGQVFIESDVPFKIPDPVWDVLLKHKANFPYTKPKPGETEVYPWHIHWMSR
jgi:acyl-coenzyme A synthetase/AMP-(fatty) acid ligase